MRDWYDLMWYLSQRPPVAPNLPLLQTALNQTQGADRLNELSWKELVRERLTALKIGELARPTGSLSWPSMSAP